MSAMWRRDLPALRGQSDSQPADFPGTVNAVFNPGATEFDGRTLLLLRVEHRSGLSSLVVATSDDGLSGWEVDEARGLQPRTELLKSSGASRIRGLLASETSTTSST